MAQPQLGRITCGQCNGWYNSERELRDHMQVAHRAFVSEQITFLHGGVQQVNFKNQPRTSKQEWAKLSGELRNRVQVHFNQGELDVIDRFILLASQDAVFNQVCP